MRRTVLAVTTALTLAVGGCAVAVLTAGSAAGAAARDDNAAVCTATSKTITDGLTGFTTDMQQVSSQATAGDIAGADATVKVAGGKLTAIGTQLTADSANADDPATKTAVTDLATEFQRLATSLTGVTTLQTFDTTKLEALATTLGTLCGVTPSPGASSSFLPELPAASATPSVSTS